MRVLFDATPIRDRPSGIRTRLLGLLPELARLGLEIGVLGGPPWRPDERRRLEGVVLLEAPRPPGGPLGRRLFLGRMHREALERFPADVVVVDALPWPARGDFIGVVHDLRHLAGGGWRSRLARAWWSAGLSRCRQVHVVSGATQAELLMRWPSARERVRLVPNGVRVDRLRSGDPESDRTVLEQRGLRPGYLLWVGHLEERKDPRLAIEIRGELARRGVDRPLLVVGRGEELPEEGIFELRAYHPLQNIGEVLRDVNDDELPALYREAGVVLCTAREEGFGMVPLEALAAGAPVVATDIPAHREVLGEAALFCPVGHQSAFANAILAVLEGRDDLAQRRRIGLDICSRWTWAAAAEAFLEALKTL